MINVLGDDAEMNRAIAAARGSADRFAAAFRSRGDADGYFSVKKPYPTTSGDREHIWIDVTRISEDGYHGTIADDPVDIAGLAYGDEVDVRGDEITDWMYLDERGRIVGGYTLRVLMGRMSAEELRESGLDLARFADPG